MKRLTIALAVAGSFRAAVAATPALTELSLEQLLDVRVVTASRYDQRASDAPSAVTVVTAEDMRIYGHRTLADALNTVPGIYISNDRAYSYIGARGFGRIGDYNTRYLLLVDGMRVHDAAYDMA